MTRKQAHRIYELALSEYRISETKVFVLVDNDIANLVKVDDKILVVFDNNLSNAMNLEEYELSDVKLISTVIPCEHLNVLKEKDIYGNPI